MTASSTEPRVYSRRGGRHHYGGVYVGRPSKWGNPFVVGRDGDQETVVELYRDWINQPEQAGLREAAREQLRGRDLVCWCAPKPCHADVLLRIANAPSTSDEPSAN